ncbi:glycosyltransferase family 4 protein, partial [Candidatus Wolfebacteria bacterium]|nr:glycosyltransferase family 4 protein [Candidatus Wolfebacteria bacterium]
IWPDEAVELGFVKSSFLIKMSYWLEDFLHRKSDFIVVNSPGIKNFLTENKRVSEDKVAVVPNAADLEFSDKLQDFSLRNKMRWEGKTVVLYAGAMSIVYDFDLILEVAKEIKNPNILFVFVGDGRQRKVMEKKVKEEKLRNVIFLGAVPKIKLTEFVAASDICIASLKDMRFLKYVYATKLMSYMAGKKPIILAMEGVSAQLVCGKAKAGLCFNPKDQAGVKQAILELASDSAQREKLGQAGYEYAREHFDSKKLARSYLDILSEIAIGRQTPR